MREATGCRRVTGPRVSLDKGRRCRKMWVGALKEGVGAGEGMGIGGRGRGSYRLEEK